MLVVVAAGANADAEVHAMAAIRAEVFMVIVERRSKEFYDIIVHACVMVNEEIDDSFRFQSSIF